MNNHDLLCENICGDTRIHDKFYNKIYDEMNDQDLLHDEK